MHDIEYHFIFRPDHDYRRFILPRLLSKLYESPALYLIACAVGFFLIGWWQDGLFLDSTFYAVIARHIAESGDWLRLSFGHYYPAFTDHPPLAMWLQSVFFLIFPPNDCTARLLGQISAVASIYVIFLIGKKSGDTGLGILSGLVLLLTYNFMQNANSMLLDPPMTFFGLCAWYNWLRARADDRKAGAYFLLGLSLAAAFLTKGVVSLPFWLGILAAMGFTGTRLLRNARFWLMIGSALLPILLFLLADHLFNDSVFSQGYFGRSVWGHYSRESSGAILNAQFITKIFRLYQPFLWLLIAGMILVLRHRLTVYAMPIITLFAYLLLYSGTHIIFNHYLVPVYAICAPLAALPVRTLLSEKVILRLLRWFTVAWLSLAVILTATGLQMHHLRSPEIYALQARMNKLLNDKPARDGILVAHGQTHWDYFAKASWLWRSDLVQVDNIDTAAAMLDTGRTFAYMMVHPDYRLNADSAGDYHLRLFDEARGLRIYVPE